VFYAKNHSLTLRYGRVRACVLFLSNAELFSGEAKKKRSNIGALLEQQEQEWVAATPSSGAGSTVSIVDKVPPHARTR
jgi:hypothetical protein